MKLIHVGPRAVLVEVDGTAEALALASAARQRGIGAQEIVPGARTVLFDGVDADEVAALVAGQWPGEVAEETGTVVLPVAYDGPDLEPVARAWGCTVDEVVERHTAREFTAAFCGFAPGFAYLAGLPDHWRVPRLGSPRSRIRAGAVALADTWCGVYPHASPGGWLVIGHTTARLWDTGAEAPALLVPGTRVRFEAT